MYPDLATLLASSESAALLAAEEDVQTAYRLSAIRTIESWAGQAFEPEGTGPAPVTKKVDGSGSDRLYLPKRLESIDSLSMTNSALDQTDVEIGSSGEIPEGLNDLLYVDPQSVIGSWASRAMYDEMRRIFPIGTRNVTISGVWGWSTTPDAVTLAILRDMEEQAAAGAHGLGASITALRRLGSGGTTQGPLSITATRSSPLLAGDAMKLIEGYVWNPAGAVV